MAQQTALVTGASSGIGRATARTLRDAGYRIIAGARTPRDLDALAAEGLDPVRLDVTDEASMMEAVHAAEGATGQVGVLVNNAGYGEMGAVEEVSLERWRRQFETNVFGLVRMAQLVLPGMRQAGGGRIVNVGSMGGELTMPLAAAYHASKYAVESVTDALRFEAAPFGVSVTLIQPAGVATRLAAGTLDAIQAEEGSPYRQMTEGFVTAMRAGAASADQMLGAEEVAAAILDALRTNPPPTRVKVGAVAHQMTAARRSMSDRAWDAMLAPQYGMAESA